MNKSLFLRLTITSKMGSIHLTALQGERSQESSIYMTQSIHKTRSKPHFKRDGKLVNKA